MSSVVATAPSVAACLMMLQKQKRHDDQERKAATAPTTATTTTTKAPRRAVANGTPREKDVFERKQEEEIIIEYYDMMTMRTTLETVTHLPRQQTARVLSHQQIVRALEQKYGGREVAHAAATIIQRAYRAARLQKKFSNLLTLALSNDRLNRRLSLLDPDPNGNRQQGFYQHQQYMLQKPYRPAHHVQQPPAQSPVERVEAEIDKLILQAAGLMKSANISTSSGPSARLIKSRRQNGSTIRRSLSMSSGPRNNLSRSNPGSQEILAPHPKIMSRDDLDMVNNSPIPPCPPLRGEEFYNSTNNADNSIYVTRDSLYSCDYSSANTSNSNYASAQFNPPRPPQRTVSFLANSTLPKKVSHVHQQEQQEQIYVQSNNSNSSRIYSDSEIYNVCETNSLHNRSISSPANFLPPPPPDFGPADESKDCSDLPLPPPPYISPPASAQSGVKLSQRSPDSPLPPPPPPQVQQHRRPCDSASSSSSIDSGYGRSSLSENGNNRLLLQQNNPLPPPNWVRSPTYITSPPQDNVFEPRASHATPPQGRYGILTHQPERNVTQHSMEVSENLINNHQHQVSDIYGRIAKPNTDVPANFSTPTSSSIVNSSKAKKTVRIQTTPPEVAASNITSKQLGGVQDDVFRRRQYRVGLNLFNQNPEMGMEFLLKKNFLDYSPAAAAKFLQGRKGISKKMIGEYLCNLQRPFNLAALHCFIHELDFAGLHLDIALRQLQQELTLPGEAQKIEKVVEVFSRRYIQCNQMFVAGFRSPDTIFVLSYAIVLLNTDLHSRAVRHNRRMRRDDFVRNLRGIDAGADLDSEMLRGIFDRIKTNEFKPGQDHVSQVSKVEETITGVKFASGSSLSETHRRLVCFCRLTEIPDVNKKKPKKAGAHQRGIFLFNDILVVTKANAMKKKSKSSSHTFRSAIFLNQVRVNVFSTAEYNHGIELQDRLTGKSVAAFEARSDSDRSRLVSDMQEAIAEMAEMEKAKMFLNQDLAQEDREIESFC